MNQRPQSEPNPALPPGFGGADDPPSRQLRGSIVVTFAVAALVSAAVVLGAPRVLGAPPRNDPLVERVSQLEKQQEQLGARATELEAELQELKKVQPAPAPPPHAAPPATDPVTKRSACGCAPGDLACNMACAVH